MDILNYFHEHYLFDKEDAVPYKIASELYYRGIELKAENERLREGLQLWIDFAANSLEFRMFLASDERYHKVFQLASGALGGG